MAPFDYEAFGLVWRTPFPCAALRLASPGGVPDVTIEEGEVPRTLDEPHLSEESFDAKPGRFLLRGGSRAGRLFGAHGGLTVQRNPGADDGVLSRYFTDRVMAAALRQRGFFVLHANAAATPLRAVVVTGESGAGKSTTLAALLDRGLPMLADDICALTLGADGRAMVVPGIAQLHLTEEAAAGLGVAIDSYPLQPWRRMKAAIPTHTRMAECPVALAAIYVLSLRDDADAIGVRVTALDGAAKFGALQRAIYGPLLPDEQPALFPLAASVTAHVPIVRIERPRGRWSIDAVLREILA
ncbi:MAG: hypothetical protein WKH68_08505 [Candidatus Limnocylindria bacterium]